MSMWYWSLGPGSGQTGVGLGVGFLVIPLVMMSMNVSTWLKECVKNSFHWCVSCKSCTSLMWYCCYSNYSSDWSYRRSVQTITFALQCSYEWHTVRQYLKPDDPLMAVFHSLPFISPWYINSACVKMKVSYIRHHFKIHSSLISTT